MSTSAAFFRLHPVFTREELVGHLRKGERHEEVSDTKVRAFLRYHQERGHIVKVRRGLYASVPPGLRPEQAPVDAYLMAAKSTEGAVLGFHSALELHGWAYSSFEVVHFLSPRPLRSWTHRGVSYHPVRVQEGILRAGKEGWGVEIMDRLGQDVRVTTRERTFVDVLDRPDLGGGWEEVWRSLEGVKLLRLKEVLAYLQWLGNATTAALVGFFLEQHGSQLAISEKELMPFEILKPSGRHYLDRSKKSRLAKRWNLMVPEMVWDRSWEEPG